MKSAKELEDYLRGRFEPQLQELEGLRLSMQPQWKRYGGRVLVAMAVWIAVNANRSFGRPWVFYVFALPALLYIFPGVAIKLIKSGIDARRLQKEVLARLGGPAVEFLFPGLKAEIPPVDEWPGGREWVRLLPKDAFEDDRYAVLKSLAAFKGRLGGRDLELHVGTVPGSETSDEPGCAWVWTLPRPWEGVWAAESQWKAGVWLREKTGLTPPASLGLVPTGHAEFDRLFDSRTDRKDGVGKPPPRLLEALLALRKEQDLRLQFSLFGTRALLLVRGPKLGRPGMEAFNRSVEASGLAKEWHGEAVKLAAAASALGGALP